MGGQRATDPDPTITREHFRRAIGTVDPTRELLTPDGEDSGSDLEVQ